MTFMHQNMNFSVILYSSDVIFFNPFIYCTGCPNVGKSSLMNGLCGRKVVSASRTPGHTKHFQTIFLTPTVRLCDSPGLVFPSLVDKQLQVCTQVKSSLMVHCTHQCVSKTKFYQRVSTLITSACVILWETCHLGLLPMGLIKVYLSLLLS